MAGRNGPALRFGQRNQIVLVLVLFIIFFSQGEALSVRPTVCIIQISGDAIGPVSTQYISQSIDTAHMKGAECLIVEIDTPGGLFESTHHIVKKIINSETPVVVYVSPRSSRAASAGTFITLAADIAAMAPGTTIGAASPVDMFRKSPSPEKMDDEKWESYRQLAKEVQSLKSSKKDGEHEGEPQEKQQESPSGSDSEAGGGPEGDVMMKKIENFAASWIQAIAELRGRNADWAIKAVKDAATLTSTEALEQNVIDLIAEDLDDLLEKLDGRKLLMGQKEVILETADAKRVYLKMSLSQRVLTVISNPNIVYFLFLIGSLGIIFEVTHPGAIFPGVIGVMCLILAFFSLQVLPVNYAGVALIFLAFVLFVLEVKITSYGLLTLGGITSLLLGSLMLFDTDLPYMQVSRPLVITVSLICSAVFIIIVHTVWRTHRSKPVTGQQGLLYETGDASTDVDVSGKVMVHGSLWTAYSDSHIPSGSRIRVIQVDGLKLKVEICD